MRRAKARQGLLLRNLLGAGREWWTEMNTTGLALGDGVKDMMSEEGDLGVEEFTTAFLCYPGDPDGWVMNHYRWIVLGLDSLERRLGRQVLTPTYVMDRPKYRYDREVDRGESSIPKKGA